MDGRGLPQSQAGGAGDGRRHHGFYDMDVQAIAFPLLLKYSVTETLSNDSAPYGTAATKRMNPDVYFFGA
jgi:hypothetical protein